MSCEEELLYCCLSHSTGRGQLQDAWREGRLLIAAGATPSIRQLEESRRVILYAHHVHGECLVYIRGMRCLHMAILEARRERWSLAQSRRESRKVGTSPEMR
jgi:hypothetical protein